MPKLSTEVNSKLKELTIMEDMSADAAVAAQVEMSIKIASAWKPKGSVTKLMLETPQAHTISIDSTTRTASITIAGKTFPIVETEADKIRARELRSDGVILRPRRRRGFQMSDNVNLWSDNVVLR